MTRDFWLWVVVLPIALSLAAGLAIFFLGGTGSEIAVAALAPWAGQAGARLWYAFHDRRASVPPGEGAPGEGARDKGQGGREEGR